MNVFAILGLFMLRISSGAINGLGYAQKHKAVSFLSWLCFVPLVIIWTTHMAIATGSIAVIAVATICSAVTVTAAVFKAMSFNPLAKYDLVWRDLPAWTKDIHLQETALAFFPLVAYAVCGNSILLAILMVYPALILHTGLINIGGGAKFLDMATDDATGKTWGLPSLGIKIPRSSLMMRLTLAAFSIVGTIVYFGGLIPAFSIKIWFVTLNL